MKDIMISILILACSGLASAAVIQFDISPNGGALSTTNYTANRDHAVGLSGLNEGVPNLSTASGGEIGAGISYDTVTNSLTLNLAYGVAFGFADLTGTYSSSHIHGGSSGTAGLSNYPLANSSAGVLFTLDPFRTAGPGNSGSYSGSLTLSAAQETALLENRYYINIHSNAYGSGEIRGQLIAVPEPSSALLALAAVGVSLRRRR